MTEVAITLVDAPGNPLPGPFTITAEGVDILNAAGTVVASNVAVVPGTGLVNTLQPVRGFLDASGAAVVNLIPTSGYLTGRDGRRVLYVFRMDNDATAFARFALGLDPTDLATVVAQSAGVLADLDAHPDQISEFEGVSV